MSNFLPNELIRRLSEQDEFNKAFTHVYEQGEEITSIRVNPFKQEIVPFENVSLVPWCDTGYYLSKRPAFRFDPLYHAGGYRIEEASSMFMAHILKEIGLEGSETRALDLCAASGGNTTLLTSYLGNRSLLVSNEINKSQTRILGNNVVRWGTANVVITNNDPSAFSRLPGYFDLLLMDASCSGLGIQYVGDEWSLENIKLCSDRQKRILTEALNSLTNHGYLIYSTRSYSREENEDILDWILTEYTFESIPVVFDMTWGIEETQSTIHKAVGYRFYPNKVKGEGFFVAILKKKGQQATFSRRKSKAEKNTLPSKALSNWIKGSEDYIHFMHDDDIHIFPKEFADDLKWFQNVLYVTQAGTKIGKWIEGELLPSHDLACSIHVETALPVQDVTLDVALQFLRKDSLDVLDFISVKKGWCLVRYEGINLGWIKVLPNKIKNYYPRGRTVMNL